MTPTPTRQTLINNILRYNMNPSSIQQNILNLLEEVLTGNDIVDATSPFMMLLETSATSTAAAITYSESIIRRLYPMLAVEQEEVFHHLSDSDYVGIYATGSMSEITVLLPYNLLRQIAVNINGIKSVIFPRNTVITVNEIDLAICYPIQINIHGNDIIQVLYDTTENNPLLKLTTNVIEHSFIGYSGTQYLRLVIPVLQITSTSNIYTLNTTVSFSQSIPFSDQFCYARAYISKDILPVKQWTEIYTTHSPIVYDINKPTIKLEVIGNVLNVILPDIYYTLQSSGNSLRIDVFTTKGILNIDLSQVTQTNFSAKWVEFDTYNIDPKITVLNKLNDMKFFSTAMLTGGSNVATLEQIRERVIYHVNSTQAPVRISDINIGLSTFDYVVQKLIDSVTDRVYIASKNLPSRSVNNLESKILISNTDVIIDTKNGVLGGTHRKSIITQNVSRSTITPDALYLVDPVTITILSDFELAIITTMVNNDSAGLCNLLNNAIYMYSPFHHVIDYSEITVTARPYFLTNPKITGRAFESGNTVNIYNIVTIKAVIVLLENTYKLIVTASIPTMTSPINNLIVKSQLSYVDKNSSTRLHLNNSSITIDTVNKIGVFTFDLQTNFDVSELDELEILNTLNTTADIAPIFVSLEDTFEIFYLVEGDNTNVRTNFDNLYYNADGQPNVIGATHETITIKFGTKLTGLYCPIRNILNTGSFVTYQEDVFATYLEDIYKVGPLGKIFTTNIDGTINFIKEHNAGDFILDDKGHNVILHKKGDYVLDINGQTIPIDGYSNNVLRQLGITMLDAKYKYATTVDTVSYVNNIPSTIMGYLENEILPASYLLAERTELYYKPKGEPRQLNVITGTGTIIQVSSILKIALTFYLTDEGIKNEGIKDKIRAIARTVISKYSSMVTITISSFIEELGSLLPNQVNGFSVNSFLPDNAQILTIVDEGLSFSVADKLVILADNTLEVKDTIEIFFDGKK